MITREYFPILSAVIRENTTFVTCSHYNLRRRCRKEIDQNERNNANDPAGWSECLKKLPTSVSQHEYPPNYPRVGGKRRPPALTFSSGVRRQNGGGNDKRFCGARCVEQRSPKIIGCPPMAS